MICKSAMHSYDIWYRLSYLCIYIHTYIYIHNINLCICTNMRNCLKHAQNMSHTHARLTNIFMYVSCACMIYIYIYTYIYIYIYIWCIYIYIYYTVLIYQYIPYASFSHISSLRVATPAGQWESMTATPRDLRQNMVSFSANQRVNSTSRRRMSWIEFSAFEYIYIYIYLYNFIHTYVCVHMSLCVRVRVEIGGNPTKNIRMLIDASYRTQRFVIPHFLHVT